MNSSTRRIFTEGLWAGLIGYAVVVLFFVIVNAITGYPIFYTAALFGAAVFEGLRDPMLLEVRPGPVLAYNMLHLLVFLGLGWLEAWAVNVAEQRPALRYVTIVGLIVVAAHLYGALLFFAQPLIRGLAWLELGAPTLIAALAMGWFLADLHPRLLASFREVPLGAE